MSSAALDRLLAALIAAVAVTGGVSLTAGSDGAGWLFLAHDVLAGLLALAVAAKLRASVPRAVRGRRWARLPLAAVVSVAAIGSLSAGFVWVAGGSLTWLDVGPFRWTVLTVHAVLGIALLPLVVAHVIPRRWRVLRLRRAPREQGGPLVPRRTVLTAGGYAAVALALVGTAAGLDRIAGGARRFTGSRWLAAGPPGVPTTFLGERVPDVDVATWRLRVVGRVDRPLELDLDGVGSFGATHTTAVLDCTSGWAVQGTWSGVPLADVLDAVGAASDATRIEIVSVTGWRATLTPSGARSCLLAWAEGGVPLAAEHGAPVRLVAPAHRGLEWVKWVDRIEVG